MSPGGPEQRGHSLLDRVGVFVATCGYLGYVPVAPGTFGSAAGLVVFAAVRATGSTGVELATIAMLFAIGIWSGTVAERHFGGVDPGPVVIDEVVGMLITLALLPVNVARRVRRVPRLPRPRRDQTVAGRRFEACHGGLGVMADDAMAACTAIS